MNERFFVINKQEVLKQEPKDEVIKIPSSYEKGSLIDRERALKQWKKFFGYYSLHPKKFNFTLREL
ncbi:MAG: hypothetical protein ACFFDH_02780 [Promethearchaeota archaeon]